MTLMALWLPALPPAPAPVPSAQRVSRAVCADTTQKPPKQVTLHTAPGCNERECRRIGTNLRLASRMRPDVGPIPVRAASRVSGRTHEHGQEEGDDQVVPQQLLVRVEHERRHALQHQQAQEPTPAPACARLPDALARTRARPLTRALEHAPSTELRHWYRPQALAHLPACGKVRDVLPVSRSHPWPEQARGARARATRPR